MSNRTVESQDFAPQIEAPRLWWSALPIAIGCAAIVAAAFYLTPDPRGYGTHEQLGLPACISTRFLHVPCPVCGMTTAFTLMAHARPADAFRTQPAGAVYFVVCVLAMASAVATLAFGTMPRMVARIARSRIATWVFALILIVGWIYKLSVFYRS